jgi:hypothetical protein
VESDHHQLGKREGEMTYQPAATFNYQKWVTLFPQLSAISEAMAQEYWNLSSLYCANKFNSVVPQWILPTLLNFLTAHLALLFSPVDDDGNPATTGQPGSPLVGRIVSANEGSVSVAVQWDPSGSPSESFFIQTKPGSAFWAACAQFRTFRYVARPTRVADGVFPYGRATGYFPSSGGSTPLGE